MSAYKHKRRNSWYVSFYYTDWTGNRHRKKKEGFASKKAALQYEHDFIQRTERKCSMLFSSFADIYLQDCRHRFKVSTFALKKLIIHKYILPYFAQLKLNEIEAKDVQCWQSILLNLPKKLSPAYLNFIYKHLSAIFNFAVKYDYIYRSPVKRCFMVKQESSARTKFWTLEQFHSFIRQVRVSSREYVIFQILFWTGIRRGEMMALCPRHFNFTGKYMQIDSSLVYADGGWQMSSPKTESSRRIITLPDFLLNMIYAYIKQQKLSSEKLLFDILPHKLYKCLKTLSIKAGLPCISLHGFRHSHASMLLSCGCPTLLIAQRLGHKNAAITRCVYSHLYPDAQKHLALNLNSLYEKHFSVQGL